MTAPCWGERPSCRSDTLSGRGLSALGALPRGRSNGLVRDTGCRPGADPELTVRIQQTTTVSLAVLRRASEPAPRHSGREGRMNQARR